MSEYSVDADVGKISQHLGTEVVAAGAVQLKRTLLESVIQFLILSVFGALLKTILSNFVKQKQSYLVLSSKALHEVTFVGGSLSNRRDFPLDAIRAPEATSDETSLRVAFDCSGTRETFKLFQYQWFDMDGAYSTDTAEMKRVGELTSRMERTLKALPAG